MYFDNQGSDLSKAVTFNFQKTLKDFIAELKVTVSSDNDVTSKAKN
ncbi:hypothetical protein [Spiroplasma endosymbiont of Nebria brevicollis]